MSQRILFDFCLRLAMGLTCMIVFTLGRGVGREFFRTLMLVVLGLTVLAWLNGPAWYNVEQLLLVSCGFLSFLGFVFWTLGRAQTAGYVAVCLLAVSAGSFIWLHLDSASSGWSESVLALLNGLSSSFLLGSMVAAMLLGHTYLIAPTMSIDPLRRMVHWIAGSTALRLLSVCAVLLFAGQWAEREVGWRSAGPFWWGMLIARGLIGLVGPAVIACMVWQTARIRSTQSATGILYAGVILVFFGELLGQLIGV